MVELLGELKAAREQGREAEISLTDLPKSTSEAYAWLTPQVSHAAAWKIGGANPWSRAVFNNSEVFFGPPTASELLMETAEISLAGLYAPLAEPEVMLRLGDLEAVTPDRLFDRVGLGFEVPASVLPGVAKGELTGQIADRAGAGALWIGAVQPFAEEWFLTDFESEFRHNCGEPIVGGSRNIIGGPLGAAREFVQLAKTHGYVLRPGQWIASGGLSPAVSVSPGDRLTFVALGKTVQVELV